MNNLETANLQGGVLAAADDLIVKFDKGRLKVLLVKLVLGKWKDRWAFPGSQIRLNEDLNITAERVYYEATGDQKSMYKEQLFTFSDPHRDSRQRCISTAFLLIPKIQNRLNIVNLDKYSDFQWLELKEIKDLAFDHLEMLKIAKERIASKLSYSNFGILLMTEEFTLSELQSLYEYCWDKKLDKRNFRKKILALNLVIDTGRLKKAGANRPATLYKRSTDQLIYLPVFS